MPDREKVIKGLETCSQKTVLYVCGQCPYNNDDDDTYDCTQALAEDALNLLKEQEAVEPKTGHWIFESAYCEAWSHTCSECGKRMTTAYNTYANYCWNCGSKMKDR